jgi:DNA-binding response OmpR family regulator
MNPTRVILVEDEDSIRDLYKRQLDLAGLPTDAFANGKDALLALQQNLYTVALLDIMLPDLNGLQILKEMRQSERGKNTAVILLTNLGQDAIIKEGFQLGADGYLVKAAYTPDQVIQEVKNIIARKSAGGSNPQGGQPGPTTPPAGTPPTQ